MNDPAIRILIQAWPIDLVSEHQWRVGKMGNDTGADLEFTGYVRQDYINGLPVTSLSIEHYPGMTEKTLMAIAEKAVKRWEITCISITHRVGLLSLGEPIVHVAVSSRHRRNALQAMEFILDYLKNEVPLWKKAFTSEGAFWLDKKPADADAYASWS